MKLILLAALSSALAFAQPLTMPLEKGVAVATCFSGWKTQNPFTIDLDGFVIGLVDVRDKTAGANPGVGNNWQPDMFHNDLVAPLPANQWTARRMGQVFGLAIAKSGNIFVAASRIYGAQGSVTETGPGLWGSAGPGGVYRIDGVTGDVTDCTAKCTAATNPAAGHEGVIAFRHDAPTPSANAALTGFRLPANEKQRQDR